MSQEKTITQPQKRQTTYSSKNPALGASAAGTAGLQIHGAFETQGPLTHTSESDPGPGPCVRPRVTSQKPPMKKRCYFTHTTKHI